MPGLTTQGQATGDVRGDDTGIDTHTEEEEGSLCFPPKIVRWQEKDRCMTSRLPVSSLRLCEHALVVILYPLYRAVLALYRHFDYIAVFFAYLLSSC